MRNIVGRQGPLFRALAVISSVAVMVTGVTFAALQSQQAVLSGNTIQSANASLLIGTTSATSTAFSNSHAGFAFQNVVPGGPAMPTDGNLFYLKNNGSAALALRLTVGSTPTNTSSVDLSKVSVVLTRVDTNKTQTATLQSLIDGFGVNANGLSLADPLSPGSSGIAYKISVSMAADAFTGPTASIGAIDFVFGGTAVAQS